MTGPADAPPAPAPAAAKKAHARGRPTSPAWADLDAALDANAHRLAALNAAVSLAAGRPPAPDELALAAAAREGLAAVVAALPPSALWGATGPAPLPAPRRAAATVDLAAGLGLLPFSSSIHSHSSGATKAAGQATAAAPAAPAPRVLVVAGPSGAGKSTVGPALTARAGPGTPFLDGDDFHTAAAKAGMAAGVALGEADRAAWLERAGSAAARAAVAAPSGRAVLACSALSRRHREALQAAVSAAGAQAAFAMLLPPRPALEARLAARAAAGTHFMPPALLASQLELVEAADGDGLAAVVRDGEGDVEAVVGAVAAAFGL